MTSPPPRPSSPSRRTPRRVTYIHSRELVKVGDALPSNLARSSLVHNLISSFNLLQDDTPHTTDSSDRRARVVEPERATRKELIEFHDQDYIDSLLGLSRSPSPSYSSDSSSSSSPRSRKRLKTSHPTPSHPSLIDDCPPFPLLPSYVPLIAGSSLTAARHLRDGISDVVLNWNGGRHHGERSNAKGFCYVNDVVLAIMELRKKPIIPHSTLSQEEEEEEEEPPRREAGRKKLSKIMYLDLDLHHGDSVESAFYTTPYILTLSLHLHAPLFFPSTGSLDSSGPTANGKSKSKSKSHGGGHALNVALESGLGGESFERVWKIVQEVRESFEPNAVVVQCGLDGLNGDPCKEWNLSMKDFGSCISRILDWNLPTMFLGGGGYNHPNAARTWTYLTSICLGNPLPLDSLIPSSLSSRDYEQYSPSFTLNVESNDVVKDLNNDLTLSNVEEVFRGYCGGLRERWGTRSKRAEEREEREREVVRENQERGKGKKRVRFEIESSS